MTCGIWKRSLPPSGFIILPHPGKPWGCPLLCRPLAPSLATGDKQGEGMRHWVAVPWTLAMSGSFCSEGSCFSFDVPALPGALIFLLPHSKRTYRDVLLGKLCGVQGAGLGFCLPPPARCSLSVPCGVRASTCGAFALLGFIREMLPFPVSLVQIFGCVDWEVPVRVGAHCHLDRTEKRNRRTHGKPSPSPASPSSMGMLTAGQG